MISKCLSIEETNSIVHGLWTPEFTIDKALDFIVEHGFNAIRLPYAISTVLSNPIPASADLVSEPSLAGLSMLDIMDIVIAKAGEHNVLIMLDAHRLRPEAGISELWYDAETSEAQALEAWSVLAKRYCGTWNVIAADLKNEPHGVASWGTGDVETDWRLAAERMGNHVLTECPRWLIFVEGVETNIAGSANFSPEEETENGWWGGKLQGIRNFPIRLTDPSKLVYSPHVYGPSVFAKPSFDAPDFPRNMPAIWSADFGFAAADFPVVIGEWGGKMGREDAAWQKTLASYLTEGGMGHFYWCLNPNSGDTGGLLKADWTTPELEKLGMLATSVVGTSVAQILNDA